MATIYGTKNSETLNVYDGVTNNADIIFGRDGDDTIVGLGGDDILKGGGGADKLWGYSGSDTVDYSDSNEAVEIDLHSGEAYGGTAEGDSFWSIENVSGSAWGDFIDGNQAVNRLYGVGGNDVLEGHGGGDYLDGGEGSDTADYWNSPDGVIINLSAGAAHGGHAEGDTLVDIENLGGTRFDDHLWGNDVDNILRGHDGNDTLKGGGGDDYLNGGEDLDVMIGGTGDDIYAVHDDGDQVQEQAGGGIDDVLAFIDYTLPENVENLVLAGDGPTSGKGNALGNNIQGDSDINVINGLGGQDYLWGEGDGDIFVWSSTEDTGFKEATADVIMDFDAGEGDRIDLSDIDADVYADGNQAFTFIGTAAFTLNLATPENTDVVPGEIRYYHSNGNTYIELQTGQSADVEAVIRLEGIVTPEASWFML